MAFLQAQSGIKRDPETGCVNGDQYEQCRTNYFLKQQNEILRQQKIEVESAKNQQIILPQLDDNSVAASSYSFVGIGIIFGFIVGLASARLLEFFK